MPTALQHKAAFRKVGPVAALGGPDRLRALRVRGTRFMSCAPTRLPGPHGAARNQYIEKPVRPKRRAPASLAAVLRRQSGQPLRNPNPASTGGARDAPALHRMPERVSSPAVKGSLRRCAPLTAHAPPIRHPVPEMPCLARARKPECVSREICNNTGAASEFSCCKRLIRLGKVAKFREKRVRWTVYPKRSNWH